MKDYGILMSIDGPDHNVIKIKPPLIFSKSNAQFLLQTLRQVLDENAMHF
jgi:4-aminobutyrate aminotransferase-like enzyme